jgi:prepilin signal peptidase PulO-like enzyme (type II secretory pathway)
MGADIAVIGLWTVLSAPACAAYGVAAANRAKFEEPTASVSLLSAALIVALASLVVASAPTLIGALKYLLLATTLSYLAAFDLRALAAPVAPIALITVLGLGLAFVEGDALERISGAVVGAGAFFAIDIVYRRIRRRSGLGLGDALVAGLIGAWLGAEALAWSVAIGGALGLAWAICRRRFDAPLPFVPALAAGTAAYLIWRGFIPS